ncbi:hypothetical protein AAFF_G00276220 [Aldrovandia affinis]|uniref:BRCA1-associated ATM activator 1 n=1 Tax=Aldrovandia affinis TaxID=143900 RepID=A0AAD7RAC8_9TELE|nr:hypothetical protein AAFF_G00276220 [Aldrovandia affinis]
MHLENCPHSLKKKAIGVVLQPLELVTASTDLQQLYSDPVKELGCQRSAVEEQLSQKRSCISLLCLSLSSTAELAGMQNSLHLEIPVQSVTLSVLKVLKVCVGMSFSSSPSSSILRNLIGCSKVQKCALDTLASLSQSPKSTVFRSEVLSVLLLISGQSGYRLHCSPESLPNLFLTEDLFPVLKKRLCDMRWEVRDSSLEFLAQLTSHFQGNPSYSETLLSSGIPDLSLTLLKDPESYVRASAVFALGHTARITRKEGVPHSYLVLQEDLARRFVGILAEDTEGFPRRAVIRVFTLWLTSPPPAEDLEESLSTVLALGSEDLDWEVKVHTLELAQILINQILAQSGHSMCPYDVIPPVMRSSGTNLTDSLHMLQQLKIFGVLFKGLFDCDRPVAQMACSILLSLKGLISGNSSVRGGSVVHELQGQSWVQNALKEHLEKLNVAADSQKSMGFVEILSVLDLEDMQQTLGQSSDYLENSPRSLMEDILTATRVSEDNIVDCY